MKLSRVGLVLVMVAILLFGWQAGLAEASEHACYRPEVLYSYLDIDRYNRSYPYVDYEAVVNPVLDHMLNRVSFVSDSYADLYCYWAAICNAKDPEKEAAAWKDLSQELNHRLHTDESVYKIVKVLFGDIMVPSILKPPLDSLIFSDQSTDCVGKLAEIFIQHCGELTEGMKHLNTLEAMCNQGVKEHDFLEAASQICKDCLPWVTMGDRLSLTIVKWKASLKRNLYS